MTLNSVGENFWKEPLGRPKRREKGNIRMVVRKVVARM
jgi:hypothetical protein